MINYTLYFDDHYLHAARSAARVIIGLANEDGSALRDLLKPQIDKMFRRSTDVQREVMLKDAVGLALEAFSYATRAPKKPKLTAAVVMETIRHRLEHPLKSSGPKTLPWRIDLVEAEAYWLIQALESQWRMASGQLGHALEIFESEIFHGYDSTGAGIDKFHEAKNVEGRYKVALGLNGGMFLGVGSDVFGPGVDEGYTLLKTILHRISWDRHPEGGYTNNFDEPMKYGASEVIPIIEQSPLTPTA